MINNKEPNYQTIPFSKGIVVYNKNNMTYGVVIGDSGMSETDRTTRIMEWANGRIIFNCPPNRALIPTGQYYPLESLENLLKSGVIDDSHKEGE